MVHFDFEVCSWIFIHNIDFLIILRLSVNSWILLVIAMDSLMLSLWCSDIKKIVCRADKHVQVSD